MGLVLWEPEYRYSCSRRDAYRDNIRCYRYPGAGDLILKKENKKQVIKQTSLVIAALILFGSCSVPKKAAQPEKIAIPTAFAERTAIDSVNVGNRSWRDIFKDPLLVALIDSALQHNIDIRQSILRLESAQAYFKQRKAALGPTVEAAVEGGIRKYGHYTESGIGNYDSNFSDNLKNDEKLPEPFIPDYFIGLRSSWEIDLWGKLKSQKQAAYFGLLAEQEGKRLLETELVSNIATAYYELMALDQKIKVYNRNIELHTNALEVVEVKKMPVMPRNCLCNSLKHYWQILNLLRRN
ncbi:TolC family protein [Sphingobacterium sp. E70]|uniref:TolC family protein n=1 Tax=Sphingobacterium sp. E70 TaxID=2853439 RepID=UPI00211B7AAC|nr:TolC family protein [Sphingobacterium sp. E70]ULT27996.1 TolC family protein [Sphingobacterium sp. E70]